MNRTALAEPSGRDARLPPRLTSHRLDRVMRPEKEKKKEKDREEEEEKERKESRNRR